MAPECLRRTQLSEVGWQTDWFQSQQFTQFYTFFLLSFKVNPHIHLIVLIKFYLTLLHYITALKYL